MPAEFRIRPLAEGSRSFTFVTPLDHLRVGRGDVCDVRLPVPWVSFHHATLRRGPTGWDLVDNGSANGTWHRGRRLHAGETARLSPRDRFAVPGFVIDVRLTPGAGDGQGTSADVLGREIYLALLRPEVRDRAAALEVDAGPLAGHRLLLLPRPEPYVIGRDPGCDWEIPDREASRQHLAVEVGERGARAVDRGSKNGLRINDRKVAEAWLANGDAVEVGRTVLVFRSPREDLLSRLESRPEEQPELPEAFAAVARGQEAEASRPESEGSGGGTGPRESGHTEPSTGGPGRRAETPAAPATAGSAAPATAGRVPAGEDVAALLAGGASVTPETVTRREERPAAVPGGTDALIVTLGVVVFLVCLVAIYLLLR